jgi:site-specific DNA-methyltransferase (adenine-specific)
VSEFTAEPHSMFGAGGQRRGRLPSGRWPANVVLDEEAAALLDQQSGTLKGCGSANVGSAGGDIDNQVYSKGYRRSSNASFVGQSGGASRFFYTAKASRREREAGLDGMPVKAAREYRTGNVNDTRADGGRTPDRQAANVHPCVKPLALMRWLVRLITPPSGIVLDPFMGSGTTGIAAALEGFPFIGIEKEAEYMEIARRRIAHHTEQGTLGDAA